MNASPMSTFGHTQYIDSTESMQFWQQLAIHIAIISVLKVYAGQTVLYKVTEMYHWMSRSPEHLPGHSRQKKTTGQKVSSMFAGEPQAGQNLAPRRPYSDYI